MKRLLVAPFVALLVAGCVDPDGGAGAADGDDGGSSPYVSLLDSPIRGLTPEQIAELRNGEGMGLSLPAELNGYPGPKHVLDMADDLGLSDAQGTRIAAIRADVVANATALGGDILAVHKLLDDGFRNGTLDAEALRALLDGLDSLYAELRFVHLNAHMLTADALSAHQRATYMDLRGYGGAHEGHGH